jgi:predicted alpha/beta hydrolase family esterase
MLDAAVLVSLFRPKPDWQDLARLLPKEPNYTLLRKCAKKIIIIHAMDDPVCPVEDAKYYAARLNAKLIILPIGGHFSVTRNVRFWRFPELLKILEKEKVI